MAAFAGIAGLLAIINALTTFRRIPDVDVPTAVGGGLGACGMGLILWFLPWNRFHPRATLAIVPVSYAFITALVLRADRQALVSVSFVYIVPYIFIAVWTGIAHPRFTYTRLLPLTATAYALPLLFAGGPYMSVAVASIMFVLPTCVLLAELVAWLVDRLSALSKSLEVTSQQLLFSEGRYRALVDNGRDVVLVLDRDGAIRFVSANAGREFSISSESVLGKNPLQITDPEDHATLLAAFADLAKNRYEEGFAGPIWATFVNPQSGERRPIEIFAKNLLDDDSVLGLVVTVRDITERRERESVLAAEANHDPLTKLLNRRAFDELLAAFLAESSTRGAVLFLDVDGFKQVNDDHGHHVGDAVLVEIAKRLRSALRPTDTLARYGGDEFVVLLPSVDDDLELEKIVGRLRAAMLQPFAGTRTEVRLGVSIGRSPIALDDCEVTELIRRADVSMFEEKSRARLPRG